VKTQLVSIPIDKPKYKIGDRVTLKSGGIAMTVVYCDQYNVSVSWSANRTLHRTTIPVEAVTKATKEKRFASVQG